EIGLEVDQQDGGLVCLDAFGGRWHRLRLRAHNEREQRENARQYVQDMSHCHPPVKIAPHGGCCAPDELVVMRHPDGVPRSPRPPYHTGYPQVREYEGDQCRSELARPLDAHDRMNNGARDRALPRARPRAFCSPYQKPSLLVTRRQNLAALGYGREHAHSILSMALREFSNEMRLYGGWRWDPPAAIAPPAFIASMRASDIACARVDNGSADLDDVGTETVKVSSSTTSLMSPRISGPGAEK